MGIWVKKSVHGIRWTVYGEEKRNSSIPIQFPINTYTHQPINDFCFLSLGHLVISVWCLFGIWNFIPPKGGTNPPLHQAGIFKLTPDPLS